MMQIKAAAALAFAATALMAQESHLSVGGGPSWKGIEIWFVTKMEPPGTELHGGVITGSGRAHHIIKDDAHKRAFGYDVALDPGEDGKTAQIRIEPWNPSTSKVTFDPGWTFLELPKYPVIPNVKVGDTVALDLLVNAATGQKVVDYLTLRRHGAMSLESEARDFTLADVEMTINQPRISANGKVAPAFDLQGGTSGVVVWLYLAGHGRFILSLVPNEKLGFKKNGVVSADGLLFRDGAAEYRVECNGRVAPGSGTYNLYVLHEANWRGGPGMIGSADKAELVVGKN
jgi:hypothetical protein